MKFSEAIKNIEALAGQIIDIVGEEYNGSVGLRGLYDGEAEELENSAVWEDGERTGEEMDGTSTITVSGDWASDPYSVIVGNLEKYAELVLQYGDGKIGLVVGEYGTGGEDIGELIIPEAKIIHTWER